MKRSNYFLRGLKMPTSTKDGEVKYLFDNSFSSNQTLDEFEPDDLPKALKKEIVKLRPFIANIGGLVSNECMGKHYDINAGLSPEELDKERFGLSTPYMSSSNIETSMIIVRINVIEISYNQESNEISFTYEQKQLGKTVKIKTPKIQIDLNGRGSKSLAKYAFSDELLNVVLEIENLCFAFSNSLINAKNHVQLSLDQQAA